MQTISAVLIKRGTCQFFKKTDNPNKELLILTPFPTPHVQIIN